MNYFILDDVLNEDDYAILKSQTSGKFETVDTGYDKLWLQKPNERINNLLTNKICARYRRKYTEICAFIRKTTPTHDTLFRVYADVNPKGDGVRADVAAVFYFSTDICTGTALFNHPTHGTKWEPGKQGVYTEDDGKWKPYFKCESVENRMFLYDSRYYHGRFPWTVLKDRHVLVKFLKEA